MQTTPSGLQYEDTIAGRFIKNEVIDVEIHHQRMGNVVLAYLYSLQIS